MLLLCIQGSPRKDGNTATITSVFAEEAKSMGAEVEFINVADKNISPCIECGTCEEKGFCPINDDMQQIYHLFVKADFILIGTPMFFYSLPAQLKALIDRAQTLWSRRYIFNLSDPGRLWRKGFMIAVGATKGKNLFEGANLTAKYFFDAIGAEYIGFLGYRKIEKKGDINKHPKAIDEVREKARQLLAPYLKRKKVLFVCTENSCRSQMAYAFARAYLGNKLDVKSAGTNPADKIDPMMIEAMAEKGIDTFYLKPQSIEKAISNWMPDLVITMGCDDKCRMNISFASFEDWDLEDPKGKSISFMRQIRDKIEIKIKERFKDY